MNRMTQEYYLPKVTEGGATSRKEAIEYLKWLGMEAKPCRSPYVSHYGIKATGSGQQHERAERFLFP